MINSSRMLDCSVVIDLDSASGGVKGATAGSWAADMLHARIRRLVVVVVLAAIAAAAYPAQANHACDPIGEPGWTMVPTHEPVSETDSAPYQGANGDWFVDRTTSVLPFCNYFDVAGLYSMRSYTLSPRASTERMPICRGALAVPPYAGACPPR
jgi:hypothetical protein